MLIIASYYAFNPISKGCCENKMNTNIEHISLQITFAFLPILNIFSSSPSGA